MGLEPAIPTLARLLDTFSDLRRRLHPTCGQGVFVLMQPRHFASFPGR
jgi:hypothetical protein